MRGLIHKGLVDNREAVLITAVNDEECEQVMCAETTRDVRRLRAPGSCGAAWWVDLRARARAAQLIPGLPAELPLETASDADIAGSAYAVVSRVRAASAAVWRQRWRRRHHSLTTATRACARMDAQIHRMVTVFKYETKFGRLVGMRAERGIVAAQGQRAFRCRRRAPLGRPVACVGFRVCSFPRLAHRCRADHDPLLAAMFGLDSPPTSLPLSEAERVRWICAARGCARSTGPLTSLLWYAVAQVPRKSPRERRLPGGRVPGLWWPGAQTAAAAPTHCSVADEWRGHVRQVFSLSSADAPLTWRPLFWVAARCTRGIPPDGLALTQCVCMTDAQESQVDALRHVRAAAGRGSGG